MDSEATLSGTAAVGAPIVAGVLRARCADGSTFDEAATSDASGRWSAAVAPTALPCALEIRGGDLPEGLVLHGFAAVEGTANVTPLTDLVLAYAFQTAPAAFFASAELANAATTLATGLSELAAALREAGFDVPEGDPFTVRFEATPSDPWDALLEQIQAAIDADPTLEGYGDLLMRLQMGELTLPAASADGMDASVPDAGLELDAAVTDDGGAENTAPATVNAALVNAYRLTFRVGGGLGCGTACDFADGQSITAVVGEDDSLTIDDGPKLTNPYHRLFAGEPHLPEIIWRDGDIEYALSDNASGAFNEINVGDLSRGQNGLPGLVGQMTTTVQGGAAIVARYADVLGISHVYRGLTPAWTQLTIGQDGSMTFNGTGPSLTAAQLGEVFDRLSCCGRIDVRSTLDLNGDSTVDNYDGFSLYVDGDNRLSALEYAATGRNYVGVLLGDRSALPMHDGTQLPETNAIAATAGDTTLSLAIVDTQYPGSTNMTLEASVVENSVLQRRLVVTVDGVSLAAGQTYDCHERSTSSSGNEAKVQLIAKTAAANTADYSTANGGRCRITIDSVTIGGPTNSSVLSVSGRFVGELLPFKRNSPAITIDDGVFRYVAP